MTYELMVLVAPTVDVTTEKKQKDLLAKLIGQNATVVSVSSLGKKELAYEIKKLHEASYLVAVVEGVVKSDDIDKKAKLMDEIVRSLLTIHD